MEQLLRQPRTFWQWLTHQEGTLFMPPTAPPVPLAPRPPSPLDYINSELIRMHDQLEGLRGHELTEEEAPAYIELTKTLSKLHDELVRRSKGESNETVPARQSKRN